MLEDAGHFPEGTPTGDFLRLVEMLTRTSDGSACGVDAVDEVFGALTMNAGVLRSYDDGSCTISLDVRYPTSTDEGRLLAAFEGLAARFGCAYEHGNTMVPFYMDPSLPEIRTLLDVAKEYRGTDEEPLVIGGGTYARHFPRACSFGPHDPRIKDPDWVGTEHGPDEGVSEEALRRALQIYIVSIARLMELDLG
jgi:succinyl-diaminopimelate desuccinylase